MKQVKKRVKKQAKRSNVWETNSSSVHTLTIHPSGIEPSNLPVDNDGYILTDFGDFGDYDLGYTAYDQATKLSYIATECYYLYGSTRIEDYYVWKNDVCGAICKYTGAPGVRVLHKTEPSINHQEQPECDLHFCNCWDDDSIINFIFNKYAGINFSHD